MRGVIVSEIWAVFKETVSEFVADGVMRLAAALAFYSTLSLAPVLVVALSVAEMFWGDERARTELSRRIDELLGPQAAESVQVVLANAEQSGQGGLAALVGLGALLFAATAVFAQLQDALNQIWHVKPRPGRQVRAFVRKRLLSLAAVFGIGMLLLSSLVASWLLNALIAELEIFELPGAVMLWRAGSALVSVGVFALLFAILYAVMPDVRISWRDAAIGAVITAILFAAGKELVAIYLGRAAVGSSYGAAGSLFALLLWVYFSSIILFAGAELTQVLSRRYGHGLQPRPWAMRRPGTEANRRSK